MSFQISQPEPTRVVLKEAVLIYERKGPYGSSTACYATQHPVRITEHGKAVIEEGRPLDALQIRSVIGQLSSLGRSASGILPPNVLSIGPAHLMWWAPPAKRRVFFDADESGVGKANGVTPHPGLIFTVCGKGMRVFAVKSKQRPVATTPLYFAPYFNVNSHGVVCTGSTPMPSRSTAETITDWEAAFFGSNFTHTNHSRSVKWEGGGHAFWRSMLQSPLERFPNHALVRMSKATVGSLLEGIEMGSEE